MLTAPGGVARTSTAPAGSGPRISLKIIFLERGLWGTGRKSPAQTFSQERNEPSHGELKSGSLIVGDVRPGKVFKNILQAILAERRELSGSTASCPAASGAFMEPVAKDRTLNTHFITGERGKPTSFPGMAWQRVSSPGIGPGSWPRTGEPQTGGDLERIGELVR